MHQRASGRPTSPQPAAGEVRHLSQGDGSGGSLEGGASHPADGRGSGQVPGQLHSPGARSSSGLAAPAGPTKQGLSALQALLAGAEAAHSGRTSPAPTSSREAQDSGQSLAVPQAEQAGLLGGTPRLHPTAAVQAEHAGLLSGRSGCIPPAAARTERYGLLGNSLGLESPAADSLSSWQPSMNSEALHAALTAAADDAATGQAGSSAPAATPDVGSDLLSQHPLQAWKQQGAALGPGRQAGVQPDSLRERPATGQPSVACVAADP